MHNHLVRFVLLSTLALAAVTGGCSSGDDTVDTANGKAISDIDIGGDVTLDKDKTQQVTATVKYADGTTANVTNSTDLVWNIGDTDVATISNTGLVTGKSTGVTKIKATYQGKESADHTLIVR